jgi:hypothetical protein
MFRPFPMFSFRNLRAAWLAAVFFAVAGCERKSPSAPASGEAKPADGSAAGADKKSHPDKSRSPAAARGVTRTKSGITLVRPPPRPEAELAARMGKSWQPEPFRTLTPDEEALLDAAMAKLKPANLEKGDALALLADCSRHPSRKLVDVVAAALTHPDADVRVAAIQVLDGSADAAILPVLQQAAQDADPLVRTAAFLAAKGLRGPEAVAFLTQGAQDSDPNVALNALDAATQFPAADAAAVLAPSVKAATAEVAQLAVMSLQAVAAKPAVPGLISALESPHPVAKAQAEMALFHMVGVGFSSRAEAEEWWKQNAATFDDKLLPVGLAPPPSPGVELPPSGPAPLPPPGR